MSTLDIRWRQRSEHFTKALSQLTEFIEKSELNDLERQGLIHVFEFTHDLAWRTLKDYLEMQGETDIHGSRDTLRLAFRRGLIEDGETWMDMLKSRTLASYGYNEKVAEQIVTAVTTRYFPEIVKLQANLESWKGKV